METHCWRGQATCPGSYNKQVEVWPPKLTFLSITILLDIYFLHFLQFTKITLSSDYILPKGCSLSLSVSVNLLILISSTYLKSTNQMNWYRWHIFVSHTAFPSRDSSAQLAIMHRHLSCWKAMWPNVQPHTTAEQTIQTALSTINVLLAVNHYGPLSVIMYFYFNSGQEDQFLTWSSWVHEMIHWSSEAICKLRCKYMSILYWWARISSFC